MRQNGKTKKRQIRIIWNMNADCWKASWLQLLSSGMWGGTMVSGITVTKMRSGIADDNDMNHMQTITSTVFDLDIRWDRGWHIAAYRSMAMAVRVNTETSTETVWKKKQYLNQYWCWSIKCYFPNYYVKDIVYFITIFGCRFSYLNNLNYYQMLYLIKYCQFLTIPDNFATSR